MPPGVTADHRPLVFLDHVGVVVLVLLLLGVLEQVDRRRQAAGRSGPPGTAARRAAGRRSAWRTASGRRPGVPAASPGPPARSSAARRWRRGSCRRGRPGTAALPASPPGAGRRRRRRCCSSCPVPGGPWTSSTGVRPCSPMNSRLLASKSCSMPGVLGRRPARPGTPPDPADPAPSPGGGGVDQPVVQDVRLPGAQAVHDLAHQ